MLVLFLSLIFIFSFTVPVNAYFEGGDIGNGVNNSIGVLANTCVKRYNLDNLSRESECNFQVVVRSIKNEWKNGVYTVKVFLNLPKSYVEKIVNNKCSVSIFNKCLKFRETTSESTKETRWDYSNVYVFEENKEGDRLKIKLREINSNDTQDIVVTVPDAKYPSSDFTLPLSQEYKVTQEFGKTEFNRNHTGIDFGIKKAKVLSVSKGIIVYAGEDITSSECNNGGQIIRIKHDNDLYSAYFHLSKIFVEKGDRVDKGEIIAISGNSGASNCKALGYHLHFELRDGLLQKNVINPRAVFSSI